MADIKPIPSSDGPIEVAAQMPENLKAPRRDYAGAQAKTDPKEIRLVRKLDFRIMVRAPPLSITLFYTPGR